MELYSVTDNKLSNVREVPFKLERELQRVFENNLLALMGLEMVKSEFTIKNKRIDTLGFDPESKAFVIIEYKREKNISVIDQGFSYLALMLENKADFIVEYNESMKKGLQRNEVDWSQTRVAFVSTSFTENQIQATNFKDIAIELWEVKRFENNVVSINKIKRLQSAESIKPVTQKNEKLKSITDEVIVFTEQNHYKNGSESTVELYEKFKNAVLNLADDIEVKPKKMEIGFRVNGKVFADICIQRKALKIWINLKKGMLEDSKNITQDVSNTGHWGNGDYQIQVSDDSNLEYIMSLVKQAIPKA